MNALQILVNETMATKGLRKAQIVSLLGFKNIAKGIRRFDAFVKDGIDSPGLLHRLPSALGLPAETVHAAYEQMLDQMRTEAETQRTAQSGTASSRVPPTRPRQNGAHYCPSPIFVVAMTGGPDRWLRISLPEEITALPEHSQIEQVAEIIRQHHAERKGWAGPFGSIIGYYYRSEFEIAVEFSVTGEVIGPYLGRFPVATCRISV